MTILIVVIVIIVCLVLISFFLLKRIVSQVDKQSKLYFALKLQEYDELVTEREEKLEEIKNEQKTEEAVSNDDEVISFTISSGFITLFRQRKISIYETGKKRSRGGQWACIYFLWWRYIAD